MRSAYYVRIFALGVTTSGFIHGVEALSQRLRSRIVGDLYADDFVPGTVRIRSPGTYHIKENIEFNPTGSHLSWSGIPEDSNTYPQNGGYILGFFAALTVEADNVEIDCGGNSIAMSQNFHRKQRFFSIIELGSAPFIAGQGPPQFANGIVTSAPLVSARNVSIRNCVLGLSSHHGMHGNDNDGVTIDNLTIKGV